MKRFLFISIAMLIIILLVLTLVACKVAADSSHVHTFGEYELAELPTCTKAGKMVRTCATCGSTEKRIIDKLGHDFIEVSAQEPTCTEEGWNAYQTCARCDYSTKVVKNPLGHNWGEWNTVTVSTCISDGLRTRVCTASGCGETEKEIITAQEHDYETFVTDPTCTSAGFTTSTCKICGESKIFDYVDCIPHIVAIDKGMAATCTQPGLSEGTHCLVCGVSITEQTEIPAFGHDLASHSASLPTCTEIGWNAYQTCRNCEYTTYIELPALGHALVQHQGTIPTCTESGCMDYETCDNCEYSTYVEIQATGHNWEEQVAEAYLCSNATCVEPAKYYVSCSLCHEKGIEIFSVGESLGTSHNWGEWIKTKEPTCAEEGENSRVCSLCNAVETEPIDKLPHVLENHTAQVPTCTEIGWNAYQTCANCEYSTYAEIPAAGHSYINHSAQVPNPANCR